MKFFFLSFVGLLAANEAEALRENENSDATKAYYIALVIVALFAVVTGIGFATVLYVLLRKQSTAKAPITRAPSESAYDNPTYKVSRKIFFLVRARDYERYERTPDNIIHESRF